MNTNGVRYPAVSGSFYPGNADDLNAMISELKRGTEVNLDYKRIIGVIVPHAGYIYSGKTALYAYSLIRKDERRKFIIIGPNHRSFPPYGAVGVPGSWETPLGRARIDESLARSLTTGNDLLIRDSKAHMKEHSVEVQIPLLQYFFGNDFSFVPIILGDQEEDTAIGISSLIKPYVNEATLIASSDLTHYEPLKSAQPKDTRLIDDIISLDTDRFYATLKSYRISACGYGAIAILMRVTKMLGGKIKKLNYSTSFDYSRDEDFVVGYASLVSYLE